MKTISELFDETTLVVPVVHKSPPSGTIPLTGHHLSVYPLDMPEGAKLRRKIALVPWLPRNLPIIWRAIRRADAVHTPIPGDIGTIGAFLAFVLRKPLFARYCQNWLMPKTIMDRAWKWFFERFAGGKNVMLATGGTPEPPSRHNPNVRWIFATSLTERELNALKKVRTLPSRRHVRLIIVCRQEKGKGTEVVIESLPNLNFKVRLDDGKEVLAHLSGRMRLNFIRVLVGDRVKVETSPYDQTKGRIIYREK